MAGAEERRDRVEDSVPQVDHAVAVGEDLEFQRRWWTFEHRTWIAFGVILLADALGLFGRGLLAKAKRQTADGTMQLSYERIERASTPSIMTVKLGDGAIRSGEVSLFVSDSMMQELGLQRVIPEPVISVVGKGGVTFRFQATGSPMLVQLALEPSFPGVHVFRMGVEGAEQVQGRVVIVP